MTKKHTFRFGIRNDISRCSAVWTASVSGDDVYLSLSKLGNQYRATFHKSGFCYVGLTSKLQATLESEPDWQGKSRFYAKWNREVILRDNQLVPLVELWFPSSHFDIPYDLAVKQFADPSKITWIITPNEAQLTIVRLFVANIAEPASISLPDVKGSLIHWHPLKNGYKLLLVCENIKEFRELEELVAPFGYEIMNSSVSVDGKSYGSANFIQSTEPGIRLIIGYTYSNRQVLIDTSARKVVQAHK